MFKTAELSFDKINIKRMLRTIRGSIKKSIFYLGARIPYDYTEDIADLSSKNLDAYLEGNGKKIKNTSSWMLKFAFVMILLIINCQ